jgi:tRNA nucleotidyltransferase/poly(A) polymerase
MIAEEQLKAAAAIAQRLRAAGYQAYFAGGCVRDLLLGRQPKDYDVATSARPEQVFSIFPRAYGVGAHFGVVLVPLEREGAEIVTEVATFRSDGVYSDGRHPDAVRYSTDPKEDVLRRDFTINGMLLDPPAFEQTGSAEKAVLDWVGGRADLRAGLVRAIGDAGRRFEEDKLRMLRAVRFAARFGFELEAQTRRAIRALAAKIHEVSRERVRDELTRMLTEGQARQAFELLDETGLLVQILPEVSAMHGVEQPPEFHPEGDVWVHTLMLLARLPVGASPTLAWAALLHDVGKPATFFEDGYRADPVAGGEPHAVRRCEEDEGVDVEAIFSPAQLRGASAASSSGLLVEPRDARSLRIREATIRRSTERGGTSAADGDGCGSDRGRVPARTAVQGNAACSGRCATGGCRQDARTRDVARSGEIRATVAR